MEGPHDGHRALPCGFTFSFHQVLPFFAHDDNFEYSGEKKAELQKIKLKLRDGSLTCLITVKGFLCYHSN